MPDIRRYLADRAEIAGRCRFLPEELDSAYTLRSKAAMAAGTLRTSTGEVARAPREIQRSEPDRITLEGPHSRLRELWLVLWVLLGTVGLVLLIACALHFVGPCVTVFGSARCGEDHPYYAVGREIGRRLARLGFTVMTGGGPGLMESANRGAREAGGRSVGCNIKLPAEQQPNGYLDRSVTCKYFFVRKVLLFKYSYAFVALPGGLGTMDELFEALTLIQTRKIDNFPVVLIGSAYWRPLMRQLDQMVAEHTIDAADLKLLLVTDDLDTVVAHIEQNSVQRYGLRRPRPSRWLGESAVRVAANRA